MSAVRAIAEAGTGSALVAVAAFDALPADEAAALLRACCGSRRWMHELVSGRPYGTMRPLIEASNDVVSDLAWSDLAEALAVHPPIAEQGPVTHRERLRRAATAYEVRFGHVFVACTAGRTPQELVERLEQRLGNPTHVEREVVRAELRAVVRLRLITTFR